MTRRINIGMLQIATSSDKEENLDRFMDEIENLSEDSDLIIAPEYLMGLQEGTLSKDFVRKRAEPVDGEFVEVLRDRARKLKTSLLFNIYRESRGHFNSSIFVDEKGEILGIYDKIHLFDAYDYRESEIFDPGNEVVTFEWNGLNVGIAVCFDLRFPDLFRIMSSMGVSLVLVPSGFYSGPYKAEQWKSLVNARANENNFFVVGVDQPAPHFVGRSTVVSPLGYEVESLGEEEEIKGVEIDSEEVKEAKCKMPLNKFSRSGLYKKYRPYQ